MITDWATLKVGDLIYEYDSMFGASPIFHITSILLEDDYWTMCVQSTENEMHTDRFGYRVGYESYMPRLYLVESGAS